ncbi:MAG: hypothetical protein R2761_06490 [Acidimicrobiales bacterium]
MDPYDQLPGQDPVTVSGRVTTARTKRYLVVAGVLAGGVTLGALFSPIGLAGAQEGGSGTSAAEDGGSTPTTQAPGAGDTTPGTDAPGDADRPGSPGGRGDHHGKGGHHGLRAATQELASVLGLSGEDLWGQLAEGKSLGEIADAQGVSRDTVTDTLTRSLADHLADEVAEGDLTQSEADARLARATDAVAGMLDRGWGDVAEGGGQGRGMGFGGHDHRGGPGRSGELQALADSLGIDLDQLRTDVMAGQTIAEAAAAQGVSADELTNALETEATERIDQALANGRIDQAKADDLKAGLEARIDDLVNRDAGDLGRGGWGQWGGGRGHGWGGMGGGHHGGDDGTGSGDGQSSSDGGETQQSSFQA